MNIKGDTGFSMSLAKFRYSSGSECTWLYQKFTLEKCENSGMDDCGGKHGFTLENTLYQEGHPSTYLLFDP
jgi:hypothetical protein